MKNARFGVAGCMALLLSAAYAPATGSAQAVRPYEHEPPLAGTKWRLVEFDKTPVHGNYYLTLKQNEPSDGGSAGSVSASDWCNEYTGVYEAGHHSLHMRLVTGTLVACPAGKNSIPFVRTLTHTSAFEIRDQLLELLNRDGAVVARLEVDQD